MSLVFVDGPLNNELLEAEFEGREIDKRDLFAFYNLNVEKQEDKLSLDQGQSQKSTPRDGNCLNCSHLPDPRPQFSAS